MTAYNCSESMIDNIADVLSSDGCIVLEDFLPLQLAESLFEEAKQLAPSSFRPAGIGRDNEQKIDVKLRTDSTLWLSEQSLVQKAYLQYMEQVRLGLNQRLFMGLFDFECHFSRYCKGDFYKRHLDAFKGKSNRLLSTVYYLNQNWLGNDGGELVLYTDESLSESLTVMPVFNRCVIFLSDTFPHEVLVSQRDRYSVAGWFRVNSTSSNQLDPAR